jgi:hypothetical protein
VEWENAFFKSSPVDEYHLPQMNSEKVFLAVESKNDYFLQKDMDYICMLCFVWRGFDNDQQTVWSFFFGFSAQLDRITAYPNHSVVSL